MVADDDECGGVFLSDVRLCGSPLSECEVAIECGARGRYRMYVKRGDGFFSAVALNCTAWSVGHNRWECADDKVEQLFEVTAYFDGVRHLEFNGGAGDMAGYVYYPDIQGFVDLFTKLRELEVEICPSHE